MISFSLLRRWFAVVIVLIVVLTAVIALPAEWRPSLGSSVVRALVAGGLSGLMEVTLMYPLENVKTQMQLQDPQYPKFDGMVDCIFKTIRAYGFLGLYGGLTPLLLSSVPSHAIRWGAYENICHALDGESGCLHSVFNVFIAGLLSGGVVAIIVGVPAECIKTRLIDEGERLVPIEGWRHVLAHCYKGVMPTIVKKILNQGLRFPVYHVLFHALTTPTANPAHFPFKGFVAGLIAGFSSVIFTQPVDVVKTKMQGIHSDRYLGSWHCLGQLYAQQGIASLYAGVAPRLVRVSIGAGITFSAYPVVKQWLQVA